MILLKEDFIGNIRLKNPETGNYIGKCIYSDKYWYQYSNQQQIKKDTTYKYIKKYWL